MLLYLHKVIKNVAFVGPGTIKQNYHLKFHEFWDVWIHRNLISHWKFRWQIMYRYQKTNISLSISPSCHQNRLEEKSYYYLLRFIISVYSFAMTLQDFPSIYYDTFQLHACIDKQLIWYSFLLIETLECNGLIVSCIVCLDNFQNINS